MRTNIIKRWLQSRLSLSLGVAAIASYTIMFLVTFLRAYLTPSKLFAVSINTYYEANVELLLFSLTLPSTAYLMYLTIQTMRGK